MKQKTKSETTKSLNDQLIMEHTPLVKYIAHKIALRVPPHIEVGDLIDAGIIGLIDAIKKYNPARDVKFRTYAEFRIRGAILDELRSLDWVPRSIRSMLGKLEGTHLTLEQRLGRPATDEEVAEEMEMEMEDFYDLLRQAGRVSVTSIDQSWNDKDSRRTVADVLEDQSGNTPFEKFCTNETRDLLAKAINELPGKERLVISLYYYEELTMKEIADVLDLTESRVSQIHTKAILTLKKKVNRAMNQPPCSNAAFGSEKTIMDHRLSMQPLRHSAFRPGMNR